MFNSELQARAAKLAREQRERDERLRRQQEKERLLAERQRQREQQREEEAHQRRMAQIEAEAAANERYQQELEANRGIHLRAQLAAAPAPVLPPERGIRRAADKLLLPAALGAELMAQGAPRNGAMLFEVAAPNGARTHAGVLDFSAPDGVVLLPPKVVDCLWGPAVGDSLGGSAGDPALRGAGGGGAGVGDGSGGATAAGAGSGGGSGGGERCSGRVTVSYRRLEKGTYVRLQPARRAFHDAFADEGPEELRGALEAALTSCCALSEGDWVTVSHRGAAHYLRVLELQPAPCVSVIDTDIAADVGPSIETEGYLRAREEEAARQLERQRQLEEERERAAAQALADAEAAQRAEEARAADEAAARLRARAAAAARLPPEPPAGSTQPHAACLLRLPDGTRAARRVLLEDPLQLLFDFADSQGAGGLWPNSYQLVAQFPRKVHLPGVHASLAEAGFAAGQQQALFLEPLTSSDVQQLVRQQLDEQHSGSQPTGRV